MDSAKESNHPRSANDFSCGMLPFRRAVRWGRSPIAILLDHSITTASDAPAIASKRGAVSLGFREHTSFRRCLCSETSDRGNLTGIELGDPLALEDILPSFLRTNSPEGMSVA